MKLTIIGSGYVGLVAGTGFAERGNTVICCEKEEAKVALLKKGISPIYEPGLEHLLRRNLKAGRLSFTNNLKLAVEQSEVIFIAVGTPEKADGTPDLKNLFAVAEEIGKSLNGYKVIVNKSTAPVGTAFSIKKVLRRFTKHKFDLASNPEFMKEGVAVKDFLKPDRIVIGVENERAWRVMEKLYHPFAPSGHSILRLDIKSAELSKYAANALLATRLSFINQIANLCDLTGANVELVRRVVGSDPRIGKEFLYPGIGYGGSCFPKDVKALIKMGAALGIDLSLIEKVQEVNEKQTVLLAEKAIDYFESRKTSLASLTVAIWGLAFKAETDDMREAPSLKVIEKLLKKGAIIKAHDPEALHSAREILGNRIAYCPSAYEALRGASALLLCTEWDEYRSPDFSLMRRLMKQPLIFDGRNVLRQGAEENGFGWTGIGIASLTPL